MAQQESSSGIVASAITILGLGVVWLAVVGSFPSQEELSAVPSPEAARQAAGPSPSVVAPPTLDFSIPKSSSENRTTDPPYNASAVAQLNPRAVQVATLRCEAEIEQLCPESHDNAARTRCLEQRATQLSPQCHSQVRERFVKWKEARSRVLAACDEDVKRFCRAVKSGSGQIVQCLQAHAPEVSDRCYRTLPKGALYLQ